LSSVYAHTLRAHAHTGTRIKHSSFALRF